MFERFTPRARHAIVLAQEEARRLQHNHIGTEHILLGLIGEPEGVAARVLQQFGLSLPAAQEEVARRVPPSKRATPSHIPFTPRSKRVLERSLREAIGLGHTYIGTEHILLGVIGDPEGVGAQILAERAGELSRIRKAVLDVVPVQQAAGPRWVRSPDGGTVAKADRGGELRTTPAADSSLTTALRIAGTQAVGSHHLLLAALSDPRSAAVRALAGLGVDLDRTRQALRDVDVTGTDDEPPEEAGRRQMTLRTSGDRLVLETTDAGLIELARAAMEALGPDAGAAGTIAGDLPACTSLGVVWQALRAALEDVRRRAQAQAAPAAAANDATPPADTPVDTPAAPPEPDDRTDRPAG
jgi:ATP-dependent Clp protease ATP-binding subunit ClpA